MPTITTARIGTYECRVVSYTPQKTTRKPHLLLVHGIGVSHRYYAPFAEQLCRHGYCVTSLDLPGYGKTNSPKDVPDIKKLADIVAEYARQQAKGQVVLVGHSMGCQIVAKAVAANPALFAKLVLLAPTINRNERSLPVQAWRLFQDSLREPWAVNKIIFRDYLRMGPVRYLITTQSMISDSIETSVKHCNVPTLVVYGQKDPIVPTEWANKLATAAPNAQAACIRGAYHVFQFTHTHELMDICQKFLESPS